MGRTPKPAAEKALTGASRRPAKTPAPDKAPAAGKFVAPTWLARKDARDVWNRVVPELARFNIMTDVFVDVIGRYCIHFADWIKISKQIDEDGVVMMVKMTHSEERMPRRNPAIAIRDTLEKSLVDIEDRFGISPLARYKIIAHQAANPGQRDLFRDQSAPAPAPAGESAPVPPRASPIGALRPSQIN